MKKIASMEVAYGVCHRSELGSCILEESILTVSDATETVDQNLIVDCNR